MRARVGQWPLAVKLWGAFAALTLLIFTLLAVLLPWTLKGFFTEQIYDILLDTQRGLRVDQTAPAVPALRVSIPAAAVTVVGPPDLASTTSNTGTTAASTTTEMGPFTPATPTTISMKQLITMPADQKEDRAIAVAGKPAALALATRISAPEGPAIQHFMISGSTDAQTTTAMSTLTAATSIEQPFVQAMEQDALAQVVPLKKYTLSIDDKSIFYVIRKELIQNEPSYIVSYAWGNYRNDLVMTMFYRLMLLMVGLIVLSWLPCLGLARYFTRPLVQMERHVGKLAEREWHEPFETKRKDEIGRLAKAIESMRQRLVRQDRAQQFFLQHTSHELKTPVMVIRSYAQSIYDGIFPKGTLHESVNVIMKEGERLEKRIRDLLLLNKLNYLTAREKPFQPFHLNEIVEDTVDRLRYRRPEIGWEMTLDPDIRLRGDAEQWKVMMENILDNQLRYAAELIRVTVKAGPAEGVLPVIRISNDGPHLDEAIAESLFEPFRSGGDGQFGLGLAIVKQIAEHHGMQVRAANEPDGAAFYIEPKQAAGSSDTE